MARNELTADQTFRIDSDIGLNSNDGITSPKKDGQAMVDDLLGNWDARGFKTTLQFSGTSPQSAFTVAGKIVGQKSENEFIILGNESNPGAMQFTDQILFKSGAQATVAGIWSNPNGLGCFVADDPGTKLYLRNLWFGSQFIPILQPAIVAGVGSRVQYLPSSNNRLLGNCLAFMRVLGSGQGQIEQGFNMQLFNSPNFGIAFAHVQEGGLCNLDMAWYGTPATGAQYSCSIGGKLYTGGKLSNIPGQAALNYVDATTYSIAA